MKKIFALIMAFGMLLAITSFSGCNVTTTPSTEPFVTESSTTEPREIKLTKYAIWDKKTSVITPIGEVLTAEQWIKRYPVAGLDNVIVVCAAGEINGGFFGTLEQMVDVYSEQGCDFSACKTPEEKLAAIEAFENATGG